MTLKQIIEELDAEIGCLHQAKAVLSGVSGEANATPGPGRPRAMPAVTKKKRNLSPEGRARIAAAVKARWAKQKKSAK
jgi:hypothetical protein